MGLIEDIKRYLIPIETRDKCARVPPKGSPSNMLYCPFSNPKKS